MAYKHNLSLEPRNLLHRGTFVGSLKEILWVNLGVAEQFVAQRLNKSAQFQRSRLDAN
jgi:hypothetical protein